MTSKAAVQRRTANDMSELEERLHQICVKRETMVAYPKEQEVDHDGKTYLVTPLWYDMSEHPGNYEEVVDLEQEKAYLVLHDEPDIYHSEVIRGYKLNESLVKNEQTEAGRE